MKIPVICIVTIVCLTSAFSFLKHRKSHRNDLNTIRTRVIPEIKEELEEKGLELGSKVFIRIFKEEEILELWLQENGERTFKLFKSFPICNYSGHLGPKLEEGDLQAPEGFYSVGKSKMNPNSKFHLSFNLGFPNSLERSLGRTGSFLMVHGACVSRGCFAMTNKWIEEIYLTAEASLDSGNISFDVHCFPFRMTESRMEKESGHRWISFWENLKQGYDWFESEKVPPQVGHNDRIYTFKDVF